MTSSLVKFIRNRIRKDMDAIVVMVGERGSCKSGCSITLSEILDRGMNHKSRFRLPESYFPKGFELKPGEEMPRVIFKPSDFLRLVSEERLPKGSCIVFDEVGVGGDSREFMSKKNKMLKQVMETIRSRNLIIFLTAPTLSSFDVSFRRSMSTYVNCLGQSVSKTGQSCALVIPASSKPDPKAGEIYTKNMIKHRAMSIVPKKVNKLRIVKPPAYLENPYKRLKELMQRELYLGFSKEMDVLGDFLGSKQKEKERSNDLEALAQKVMINPLDYFDSTKKKFVPSVLQTKLNIPAHHAINLKQLLMFRLNNGELKLSI